MTKSDGDESNGPFIFENEVLHTLFDIRAKKMQKPGGVSALLHASNRCSGFSFLHGHIIHDVLRFR